MNDDSSERPNTTDETVHHVGTVEQIRESGRIIRTIDGDEVAIFTKGDEFYALSNYCPHQGGPACEGPRRGSVTVGDDETLLTQGENNIVCCAWHGWEFDIETGEHIANPAYRLKTYETVERGGDLYIRM